jgi:ribosome-associated heat shock protein Hsp15
MESVRVDKWLWAARCFKSRSQATHACDGGLVKVDDTAVKPAYAVHPGQTVDVRTPGGHRVLKVVALGERRGPASVAATLYEDLTPPEPEDPVFARRDRGSGRPTGRDRRSIAWFRGED